MYKNLTRNDGGFNPILKRCYNTTFSPFTEENIKQDDFLLDCYQRHFQAAKDFFKGREQDLLVIDVSKNNSYSALTDFLLINQSEHTRQGFDHINIGGKVTAWKNIKHPLKIEATLSGRVDKVS